MNNFTNRHSNILKTIETADTHEDPIAVALKPLIGLRLSKASRIETMIMLSFGDLIPVEWEGATRIVGAYSLHIQCPWRIRTTERILVASGDMLEESRFNPESNISTLSNNLCDQRFHELFSSCDAQKLLVERIEIDYAGAFKLHFFDSLTLEVIPITSFDVEHWRLFKPGSKYHFVYKEVD